MGDFNARIMQWNCEKMDRMKENLIALQENNLYVNNLNTISRPSTEQKVP
jgi:hypothetical protein